MSYYYTYVPHYSGEVTPKDLPTKPKEPAPNPWLGPPAPPAYVQYQVANSMPTYLLSAWANKRTLQVVPGQYVYQAQAQSQPQLYYAAPPVPEPVKHNFWHGGTKAEVDAQNAAVAKATGATDTVRLIPEGSTASSQYYCRELDGSYTLRTTTEIMETLQPGYWQYANPGGYPYWVRTKTAWTGMWVVFILRLERRMI